METATMYLAYAKSGLDREFIDNKVDLVDGDWEFTEMLGKALKAVMPVFWHDVPWSIVLYDLCEIEIPKAIMENHRIEDGVSANEDDLRETIKKTMSAWYAFELLKWQKAS